MSLRMSEVPAIGIDLGTTYSCAAVFRNDRHEIIKINRDANTMASCVSYTKNGRLIGDEAKENSLVDPTTTIFGVKRFIGRRFNDEILQQDLNTYPFEIVDVSGNPKIKITYKGDEKLLSPEEISATILEKIKDYGQKHLGQEVKRAVVTVPAHFNDSQRQATRDAGRIAGLDVLRIINEPTAAAFAYGIQKKYQDFSEPCNVLIYDFGGGTFDVSIISIDDGIFDVKATNGDTHLGGDDLDLCLVDYFTKEFQMKYKKDLSVDNRATRRLRMQCEKLKKTLSRSPQASIDIDMLFDGQDFFSGMTKSTFEALCEDFFEKTLNYVDLALNDAKMRKNEIHEVVLVGGSTRIPKVQEKVQKYFSDKQLNMSLNPDEAVAIGAAIQAAILDGNPEGSEIIGSLLLMDVNSLSLGIEIVGGIMSTIIPRNSQIPIKLDRDYETAYDNQTSVKISVYEGERLLVAGNTLLGEFSINGIKPAKRGQAKIKVSFDVNTDGILHVTAVETKGNIVSFLSIHMDKNRLTEEDINRMIQDAETYKRDDLKWEAAIQARLNLERYCSDTKWRICNDFARFMSQEDKEIIVVKCDEALKWAQRNSDQPKEEYEAKQKEVYNVCSPIIRVYM